MDEENISVPQLRLEIKKYRTDRSELGKAKFAYYSTLLEYKEEVENDKLRKKIRQKLKPDVVGGTYSAKAISKVLNMPTHKVNAIESKVIRMLKSPSKSRDLKMYLNEGY